MTIRHKCQSGEYDGVEDFVDDMTLMFKNAFEYNKVCNYMYITFFLNPKDSEKANNLLSCLLLSPILVQESFILILFFIDSYVQLEK